MANSRNKDNILYYYYGGDFAQYNIAARADSSRETARYNNNNNLPE